MKAELLPELFVSVVLRLLRLLLKLLSADGPSDVPTVCLLSADLPRLGSDLPLRSIELPLLRRLKSTRRA